MLMFWFGLTTGVAVSLAFVIVLGLWSALAAARRGNGAPERDDADWWKSE